MSARRWLRVSGVLLVGGGLLSLSESSALSANFVIVVNASNTLPSLSRSELRKASTGLTKQWGNGAVVQLGLIPHDAPETDYLASQLDLSSRELIGRIQEQVFKGEMRRPIVLKSSQDCVNLARARAGAICVALAGTPIPPEAHVVPLQ